MARLPSGVVVVSARYSNGYRGLTASSLVSISADPPLVMVGLEREATTRTAVVEGGAFNVSVLTRTQEFIADRLAGRAPAIDESWSEIPHRLGTNGIPLIDGCVAWLECTLSAAHEAGDHDRCVGKVEEAVHGRSERVILLAPSCGTLR